MKQPTPSAAADGGATPLLAASMASANPCVIAVRRALPNSTVEVVDPSVIDEIALQIENSNFRSHFCAALLHQGMPASRKAGSL